MTMTDEVKDTTTATGSAPVTAASAGGQSEQDDTEGIKTRLERARRITQEKILKDLGVDSLDALKATVAEAKALKESQMSEAQKAIAALDKERLRADAAEAKAAELESARLTDKVNGAITTAALSAHAEHPQDVVDLLRKGELEGVLDDKGNVNAEKVKALVEQARKDRPAWFQTGGVGSPSNRSGSVPETLAAEKQRAIQQLTANLRNKF